MKFHSVLKKLVFFSMMMVMLSSCQKVPSISCITSNALNYGATSGKCTYSQVVFYVSKDSLNGLPILPLQLGIDVNGTTFQVGTIQTAALNQPNNCSSDLPNTVYIVYQIPDSLPHNWTAIPPNPANTITGMVQATNTQDCIPIKIN